MWYVAAVFLLSLSLLASGTLNYCSSRMCSYTNAHTFCQFSGGPGPQCIGHVESPLSTEEKIRLVIRLNQRRAAVASGRLRGYPPAGNMLKLLWMEELAREAQLWADQCEPPRTPEENDACRDLYSMAIGQCVASVIGEAPGLRPESMVDMWYMQNMFYKGNVTSYDAPVNNRHNYYGDFAQLVYSKTYMVGCGRSKFMVLMSGRLRSVERLVCNFAPRGPGPGKPLWTVASPGTACPPRSAPDDNVPALCTVKRDSDETHDEDQSMSLEEHILLESVFEVLKNESLNYIGSLDEIYLTKVAAATITDVVTMPMAYNALQKRSFFETFEKENGNSIQEYQTTEEALKTDTVKPETKLVLVGRPKSYNIDELSEVDHKLNSNNPDTEMQDLPVKRKQFDIDYEFSESNYQGTTRIEKSSANTQAMTAPETVYTFETTDSSTRSTNSESLQNFVIAAATTNIFEITPYTEAINIESVNPNDYSNLTMSENETDALIDEYLSDPETVKQLQEELYRMEQAMSTMKSQPPLTTTERADKVRRALRDGSEVYDERNLGPYKVYPMNDSKSVPELLQMFSEDANRTSNPMISMAMRYIPFMKGYASGMNSGYSITNGKVYSNFCILLIIFCIFNVL